MEGNITLTKRITITNVSSIDLNGYELTATDISPVFYVDGGKLTLSGDGTVQNNRRIGAAANGGEIIIDGGNYVSTSDVAFEADQNGKVTMNNGTINAVEGGIIAPAGNGSVEVNGGVISVSDNFALATNGGEGKGNNLIVVNGGQLIGNITTSGYEAVGVYVANNDIFIMNGGEITAYGGTGLCMRGGSVVINDGTINALKTKADGETIVPDGKIGDNDTAMYECAGIIYHETANYPGKDGMKLTVNGGTINGVEHSIQILSNEDDPKVYIYGGTLNPLMEQNYDSNEASDDELIFDGNPEDGVEDRIYDAEG